MKIARKKRLCHFLFKSSSTKWFYVNTWTKLSPSGLNFISTNWNAFFEGFTGYATHFGVAKRYLPGNAPISSSNSQDFARWTMLPLQIGVSWVGSSCLALHKRFLTEVVKLLSPTRTLFLGLVSPNDGVGQMSINPLMINILLFWAFFSASKLSCALDLFNTKFVKKIEYF